MTTTRELITGALRLINVVQANETPTAADMDISLSSLQAMIDSWSTENLNIYLMKQYYFPLTAGQKEYTLGPGPDSDWTIVRPMRIQAATVSYNGSLVFNSTTGLYEMPQNRNIQDIPIEILNMDQYAAIAVKNQQATYPTKLYDNGNSPNRLISVWPVPTINWPVTLWLWLPLTDPTTLDNTLNLPRGYERALRYNLAVELAPEFGRSASPNVQAIASDSIGTLRRLNSRPGQMRADNALVGGPSIYNWNLGTTIPN